MTQEQQEQFLAFIANMIYYLHEEGMDYEHTKMAVDMAASCLLAVLFHIKPDCDDITELFIVGVINAALHHSYPSTQAQPTSLQA